MPGAGRPGTAAPSSAPHSPAVHGSSSKSLAMPRLFFTPEVSALEIQVSDQKRAQNNPQIAWQTSQTNKQKKKNTGFCATPRSHKPSMLALVYTLEGPATLGSGMRTGPRRGATFEDSPKQIFKDFFSNICLP